MNLVLGAVACWTAARHWERHNHWTHTAFTTSQYSDMTTEEFLHTSSNLKCLTHATHQHRCYTSPGSNTTISNRTTRPPPPSPNPSKKVPLSRFSSSSPSLPPHSLIPRDDSETQSQPFSVPAETPLHITERQREGGEGERGRGCQGGGDSHQGTLSQGQDFKESTDASVGARRHYTQCKHTQIQDVWSCSVTFLLLDLDRKS